MAVESLALGVLGKLSLWRALKQVADQHPAIASVDLDELIDRAEAQYDLLEHERLAAGRRALGPSTPLRDRTRRAAPGPQPEVLAARTVRLLSTIGPYASRSHL